MGGFYIVKEILMKVNTMLRMRTLKTIVFLLVGGGVCNYSLSVVMACDDKPLYKLKDTDVQDFRICIPFNDLQLKILCNLQLPTNVSTTVVPYMSYQVWQKKQLVPSYLLPTDVRNICLHNNVILYTDDGQLKGDNPRFISRCLHARYVQWQRYKQKEQERVHKKSNL
jgi:hypothetical protein